MLPKEPRELRRLDVGGTDAGDLVGRKRHANARAADEDSALGPSRGDETGDLIRIVGVVTALPCRRPQVSNLMAEGLDVAGKRHLLVKAPMI